MLHKPLIFVSGKGGTGKSAVAAAIGLVRARAGERVLCVDMGGGLGLASHLRRTDLGYAPVEVRPGLFAMEIDRARALDEYLKLQLHVPQGSPTRQLARALSVLVETAPGVREIISIGKPIYESWSGRWDAVIVDAPSLGQFQSYLHGPGTIAGLAPSGTVRRQAERLVDTLTDPDVCSVMLVTTPSELATAETRGAIEAINSEELTAPPSVIANRVVPHAGFGAEDIEPLPEGSLRDAARLQLSIEEYQRRWISELPPNIALPFLRGVHTPGEVATLIADELGAGQAAAE